MAGKTKQKLPRPCLFNTLNIITWNVRGIMSSAASLSQTLDDLNIDIAFITEHKLLPHMKYFMDHTFNFMNSHVKLPLAKHRLLYFYL